jgi:hypothetical protein
MSEETRKIKEWCVEVAAGVVGKPQQRESGDIIVITTADAMQFAKEIYEFLTEE